jgi:hypothetical protein
MLVDKLKASRISYGWDNGSNIFIDSSNFANRQGTAIEILEDFKFLVGCAK